MVPTERVTCQELSTQTTVVLRFRREEAATQLGDVSPS